MLVVLNSNASVLIAILCLKTNNFSLQLFIAKRLNDIVSQERLELIVSNFVTKVPLKKMNVFK